MIKKFLNKVKSWPDKKFFMPGAVFLGCIGLAAILLNVPLKQVGQCMIYHIDAYLVSWIWSWEAHILTSQPWRLFEANIFAPFQHTLAFTETMLGSFLLAWPWLLVSHGNAALAYNAVMLLTYGIAGVGMYRLVFYLTHHKLAALISTVIYALAPFKLVHNGHLHLSGMWLPYVFLYLDKFSKQFKWSDGLKLAASTILVFLTSLHYAIFLPLAGLIFLLIKVRQIKFEQTKIIKIVLIITIISLVVLPVIIPYLQARQEYGQLRGTEINKKYAPTVIDYLTSPLLYNNLYAQRRHIEMIVSPGWVIWLLLISALIWLWRKRKLLKTEMKKTIIFYLIMGGLAVLISFGFYWRLTPDSQNYWPGLFAAFYAYWPGFSGIRASGRYSVFFLLSLAVISGIAISYWQKMYAWLKRYQLAVGMGLIFLILFELAMVPSLSYVEVSLGKDEQNLVNWIKAQPADKIFLELPMGVAENEINYDVYYVFASRWHFRKIVNGYSGYYPPGYLQLAQASRFFKAAQIMPWLEKFKVNYVIFHWARYPTETKKGLMQNLQQNDKIKYIANFGENYVYEVLDE